MQVILGSGGATATPLALHLATFTDAVRCCSRTPHALPSVPGTAYTHLPTDLLDATAVEQTVAGAEVVYLTAGLTYDIRVWRVQWPRLIDNVIAACAKTRLPDGTRPKLVFMDSIYPYAASAYGHLDETAPLDPPSAKGKIRADIRKRVLDAHQRGDITACVAVAADFYGAGIANSLLNELIVKPLKAGKSAQWLIDADLPHSFTYTLDIGRDLALLGNADGDDVWGAGLAPLHRPARVDGARMDTAFGRRARRQAPPPGVAAPGLLVNQSLQPTVARGL